MRLYDRVSFEGQVRLLFVPPAAAPAHPLRANSTSDDLGTVVWPVHSPSRLSAAAIEEQKRMNKNHTLRA